MPERRLGRRLSQTARPARAVSAFAGDAIAEPIQRTEWNVRDADRLMILIDVSGIGVSKGTVAARDFALALGKPLSMIDLDAGDALAQALACAGKDASDASSIGIAGPRESEVPDIYAKARPFYVRFLPGWHDEVEIQDAHDLVRYAWPEVPSEILQIDARGGSSIHQTGDLLDLKRSRLLVGLTNLTPR